MVDKDNPLNEEGFGRINMFIKKYIIAKNKRTMTNKKFVELLLETAGFELVNWNMHRVSGGWVYDGEAKRNDEYIDFSGQLEDVISDILRGLYSTDDLEIYPAYRK